MTYPQSGRRIDVRRAQLYGGIPFLGPQQSRLLYDWNAGGENITPNGTDAVSVLCRNKNYGIVPGFEYVQAVAAKQALWNATDVDLNNQPTLEGAGAEQYATANAITLPTQCTFVVVAKDENGGAFASIFEHAPNYVSANGGLALYSSANLNAGLHFTSQTVRVVAIPGSGKFVWVVSIDFTQAGAAAFPLARVNNVAMGATGFNASTAGTFRSAQLMLLGRSASQFWVGPWALTRVYDGLFTGAEADAEYAYMKARFGLP